MSILRAKKVSFNRDYLIVLLDDERIIQTPLKWYKELEKAKPKELESWVFICDRTGIFWESLDFYLSVSSMLSSESRLIA